MTRSHLHSAVAILAVMGACVSFAACKPAPVKHPKPPVSKPPATVPAPPASKAPYATSASLDSCVTMIAGSMFYQYSVSGWQDPNWSLLGASGGALSYDGNNWSATFSGTVHSPTTFTSETYSTSKGPHVISHAPVMLNASTCPPA